MKQEWGLMAALAHWLARACGALRSGVSQSQWISHHRGGVGHARDGGTAGGTADGIEDVQRVWKNALHAILHWTDLEGRKRERGRESSR